MKRIAGILFCALLISCAMMPSQNSPKPQASAPAATPTPAPTPAPTAAPLKSGIARPALSWEKNHPERKAWSDFLFQELEGKLDSFDKAKDVARLSPSYASLPREKRLALWAEFWSALTYFESSWNPSSNSVDVGTPGDSSTYSVGLAQLSAVDCQSYNLGCKYTFHDLQDPKINLRLALAIMEKQILKRGKIFIGKGEAGLYWAVIHNPGGKYDQTEKILAMVRKLNL